MNLIPFTGTDHIAFWYSKLVIFDTFFDFKREPKHWSIIGTFWGVWKCSGWFEKAYCRYIALILRPKFIKHGTLLICNDYTFDHWYKGINFKHKLWLDG